MTQADPSPLPAESALRQADAVAISTRWLDLSLVAVITFVCFAGLIGGPLSPLDDYLMIVRNERVHTLTAANLYDHWTTPSFRIYMPIPLTIWNVLVALARHGDLLEAGEISLSVWPFKLVSVLSHSLAAAAATWALAGLLPSAGSRSRWAAVLGGLIVGLHPFQVESVGWTTGLKDVLCGLFAFLAIGAYARFARSNPRRAVVSRDWRRALLFTILACLCKPTAMTLPATCLVIDWLFRGRRVDLARRIETLWPIAVPAFVVAAIMLSAQANPAVPRVATALRPLVAGDTLAFYLVKLVAPYPLLLDYGRHPVYILNQGAIWYTWLLPAAVFGLVLWTRSRLLLLAVALIVIPLAPVSGLVPFDMQQYSTPADHYMYQPLLGVGLAVAMAVLTWPRAAGRLAVVALVAFGVATVVNVFAWRDMLALHLQNFAWNNRSAMVAGNLGFLYIQRGEYDEAERWSQISLDLNPESPLAWTNRSVMAARAGRYREAADYLEKILPSRRLKAETPQHLLQLASLLNDVDLAERAARRWLQVEPGNQRALGILADIQRAAAAQRRAATRPSTGPASLPSTAPSR